MLVLACGLIAWNLSQTFDNSVKLSAVIVGLESGKDRDIALGERIGKVEDRVTIIERKYTSFKPNSTRPDKNDLEQKSPL